MPVQEGKAAPAFTLPDENGKPRSLADFAGKDVVLYFYPKDDTPGCTKEACGFRDAWKELGKRGVVVLGVSGDDADSKAVVTRLLTELGHTDVIDLGPLETARGAEALMLVWLRLWGVVGSPMFGYRIVR